MNKIGWIIFAAVAIGLIVGLVIWSRLTNPSLDVSSINNNSVIAASEQNGNIADHVQGAANSKVILVEYGDFQCPSCRGAHPNVNTLLEEYGDRITFIFRNFPLTTIHPNARAAAAAAEAAGLQGKYWDMNSLLYEAQKSWEAQDATTRTNTFRSYALQLGLDVTKFEADIASKNVNQKISFDQALGKREGLSGTPSFFLNGQKLTDEVSGGIVQGDLTAIRAALDKALSQ